LFILPKKIVRRVPISGEEAVKMSVITKINYAQKFESAPQTTNMMKTISLVLNMKMKLVRWSH
jgi:hypothetical protein